MKPFRSFAALATVMMAGWASDAAAIGIPASQAATLTVPGIPGDGVHIALFNGIGGGGPPTPGAISGRTPSGTTLSPFIDFPRPGTSITVGQSFTTFFANTANPPDAVKNLAASNFITEHTFFLAITQALDRNTSLPGISIGLGVGSDDGFYLVVGSTLIGSAGDRGFSTSAFDLEFESPGLYPVKLLFAANSVGASGLEFYWHTASSGGLQVVPQAVLYTSAQGGQELITFDNQTAGAVAADQYRSKGAVFATLAGDVRITNAFPGDFIPITQPNVLACPAASPASAQSVELTFVAPGTNDPGVTDLVEFYLIDADSAPGAQITATDQHGTVIYNQAIVTGGGVQQKVTIAQPLIHKVIFNLGGNGTDTSAIDNLSFNTPRPADLTPPAVGAKRIFTNRIEIDYADLGGIESASATQVSTYEWLGSGPDGVFGGADDHAISISSVTPGAVGGTFVLNPAATLPDEIYRLTIKESPGVKDTSGNLLDGDGDGQAGGDHVAVLTLDAVAASVIVDLQAGSDTGPSATDNITSQTLPVFDIITNESGILTVNFDGGAVEINEAVSAGTRTFSFETPLADGNHTAVASFTAVTPTGSPAQHTLNFVIDTTPPEINAVSFNGVPLAANAIVRGEGTIGANASDATGVVKVEFFIRGQDGNNLLLGIDSTPNNGFTVIWPAATLEDGDYVITARAFDMFDKMTETERAVRKAPPFPALSLALQQTAIQEGGSTEGTVTLSKVWPDDISVALGVTSSGRLSFPAAVMIPAGQLSATFTVHAVQNTSISPPVSVTLLASSAEIPAVTQPVQITDDDTPAFEFTLDRAVSGEGAGAMAVRGTVRLSRTANVNLLASFIATPAGQVVMPGSVVIPANTLSVPVYLGIIDNAVLDGNRDVMIHTQVAINGGPQLAALPPATLTITDNEAPSLAVTLDRDLLVEGRNPAAIGTVFVQPVPQETLTVNLAASDPLALSVPPSVIIPAGQASATFPIGAANDGQPSGTRSLSITATAAGFNPGAAAAWLTDVAKPDLIIQLVSLPAGADTDAWINVTFRLTNQGAGVAPGPFLQRFYLSADDAVGNDSLIGETVFSDALPALGSIEQTVPVRLPKNAGRYWMVAQTDAGSHVEELPEVGEGNNIQISVAPIDVEPAYQATLAIAPATVPSNTPIPITGTATLRSGGVAKSVLVNIHVTNRGIKRVVSALTNSSGQYSLSFLPLPGEGGLLEFGAAHPGVTNAAVQDEVRVYGLSADPARLAFDVGQDAMRTGSVIIRNTSDLPLTGLTATVDGLPPVVDFTPLLSATNMASGGEVTLDYTLTAHSSAGQGSFAITVRSAEGAVVTIPAAVRVVANTPRLVVAPAQLQLGMLRGQQQFINLTLRNDGQAATGPIKLLLPGGVTWLQSATVLPAPPLAPGESLPISLQLTPPAGLALGDHSGTIVATGGNVSLNIPFTFRALSDQKGQLRVRVEDEYTYYGAGNPLVSGASVRVTDAVSGEFIGAQTTGASGVVDFGEVREGYYMIEATADRHTNYRSAFLVQPGLTNVAAAFLSRQTVTYSWTVVPVQIEDRYRIVVETTFETNVPVPVITVEPTMIDLKDVKGNETIINIKVSNHGLIAANNTRLGIPTHPQWTFTPLISTIGTLPANSSMTIPMVIRRNPVGGDAASDGPGTHGGGGVSAANSGGPCTVSSSVCWDLVCGTSTNTYCATMNFTNASPECGFSIIDPLIPFCPFCGPGGGGGSGGGWDPWDPWIPEPGTGRGGTYSQPQSIVQFSCDPDCLVLALLGCIPGPIGCAAGGYACGKGLADGVAVIDVVDCAVGLAGCVIPGAGVPACIYSLTRCFVSPAADSDGGTTGESFAALSVPGGLAPAAAGDPLKDFKAGIRVQLDIFNDITGAPDGVWANGSANATTGEWFARFASAVGAESDGGRDISSDEQTALLGGDQPPGVPPAEVTRVIQRWNRTMANWAAGINKPSQAPPGASHDFIDGDLLLQHLRQAAEAQALAEKAGFTDPLAALVETVRYRNATGQGGGSCARIKLQLEQEAVITRDAFRATLEVGNNGPDNLENVQVDVTIRPRSGTATTNLFSVQVESVSGMTAVDGTGSLAAETTGTARWLIIPTVDAAPTEPTEFLVGGTLSYYENGLLVSLPLYEASITVLPCPRLTLKYYHQRDVYSDDPFTPQIEPAIPYTLAVMIRNNGYGVARNMRITSGQPRIIDNEKGLLADFRVIATRVAGQPLLPSLTADFGTINPGDIKIGEWLMTSTLQGLFVDYNATFRHLDARNEPRLSLIDSVEIFEMIHPVEALGALSDGKPDYLVNEIPDLRKLPDTVHLSDGSTAEVAVVETAAAAGDTVKTLTATLPPGFVYLRIPEPSGGSLRLTQVTRSDGLPIPIDVNAWVTDRTFVGQGLRPVNETILHLFDHNSTGSYTLKYEVPPDADVTPPTSHVLALAGQSPATFAVNWQGADDRGVAFFDIFVSTDDGPFEPWLQGTRETGALFQGIAGRNYAFNSRATDAAGNAEPARATPDALTTVSLVNEAPVLAAIADQEIEEGSTLILDAVAMDPDGELSGLSFDFAEAVPPGLTISAITGRMQWTTGESDGGREVPVHVRVTDAGSPPLSAVRAFVIRVRELNAIPELDPVPPQTLEPGGFFSLQLHATDSDLPLQPLSYSFVSTPPAGMAINATTGLIEWQTSTGLAGAAYNLTVRVQDTAVPPGSATRSFTLTIETLEGNSAPVAHDSTNKGRAANLVTGAVTGSDPDDDPLTFAIKTQPQHGSATMDPDGSYRVRLGAGFSGLDTFTFAANDGATDSVPATVTLSTTSAVLEWTWIGGASADNQFGAYGTLGTAAAGNSPGARSGAASWQDQTGAFWLFGGTGHAATKGPRALNDLWRRDPQSGHWAWIGGSKGFDAPNVYGTLGQSNAASQPGARTGAAAWTGADGKLWLFGGRGKATDSGAAGLLNDLWVYDPATGLWTWMGGGQLNANGNYGTAGIADATNQPGGRTGATAWTDAAGALWLFGGSGMPAAGAKAGVLNDLWRYDPAANQWTFVRGSAAIETQGSYGLMTLRNPANQPGGRTDACAWSGLDGRLWLFGGNGRAAAGTGYLSDLWCYLPDANEWVWMSGANSTNAGGDYGTLGVTAASNRPGARAGHACWIDAAGQLWLFGGQSQAGHWNDVWRCQPDTGHWTWMKGPRTANGAASHGTLGMAAANNTPGSRRHAAAFVSSSGGLCLFGGAKAATVYSDLWQLNLPPIPLVQTLAATEVDASSAMIHAMVNTQGLAAEWGVRFWRSDQPDAVSTVMGGGAGPATAAMPFSLTLSSLTASTVYAAQAFATNIEGTAMGRVVRFTTAGEAAPIELQFVAAAAERDESDAALAVQIMLSRPAPVAFSVPFNVSGTAATGPGGDARVAASPVFFVPGQTSASILITILNDNLDESDETVVLTLGTPGNGIALGGRQVFTLTLIDDDAAPVIVKAPESQFRLTGSDTLFAVDATGSPPLTYLWKKNGARIAGATGPTLQIPGSPHTAAGTYAVEVSNATGVIAGSPPFELSTVDAGGKLIMIKPNAKATMAVRATSPGALEYRWLFNGGEIADAPPRITGAGTKQLVINPAGPADAGIYLCRVTRAGTSVSAEGGAHRLAVVHLKPEILPIDALITGVVGGMYEHVVAVNPDAARTPQSFTAAGLVTGLAIGADGVIRGIPTAAAANKAVTITARNTAGSSAPEPCTLTILPLPPRVPGTYIAAVDQHPAVNRGLGGRIDLTITTAGKCTGKLQLNGVQIMAAGSLAASVDLSGPEPVITAAGRLVFTHPRDKSVILVFEFVADSPANTLDGTLTDVRSNTSAGVNGYRQVWNSTTAKAAAYKGYYTFGMRIPADLLGDAAFPQGQSFGNFTITDAGSLTAAGHMADGLTFSTSTITGPAGEVMVFVPFGNVPGGSLLGVPVIDSNAGNQFTGSAIWTKEPAAPKPLITSYAGGFDGIELDVRGGPYAPPGAGGVLMDLPNINGNAVMSFSETGLPPGILPPVTFSIRNLKPAAATQSIILPAAGAALNPARMTFRLATKPAGYFSGDLVIGHPVPALVRKVPYQGSILNLGNGFEAAGFLLIPDLPQPGESLKTTPQRSGHVRLEAAPTP